MTTASVSELKARLSSYLREVRQGGEVQVLDRGTPVARLVPIASGGMDDTTEAHQRRHRLIASGVLRPGTGVDVSVLPLPATIDLGRTLDAERADRL